MMTHNFIRRLQSVVATRQPTSFITRQSVRRAGWSIGTKSTTNSTTVSSTTSSSSTSSSSSSAAFGINATQQQQQQQVTSKTAALINKTRVYKMRVFNWMENITSKDLMKFGIASSFICLYLYMKRERVPISDRLRFNILPSFIVKSFIINSDALTLVKLSEDEVPHNTKIYNVVEKIGSTITEVNDLDPLEYHVIKSDQINAFVTPGGQVFVNTALFKVVANEDELAIVLGHEISHKLAKHVIDRLILNFCLNVFWMLLDSSSVFLNKFGEIAFSLPYSRENEREADYIGLMLAAEAGYDPRHAQNLWIKMLLSEGGVVAVKDGDDYSFEFNDLVSTHPSNQERIHYFRPDGPWMKEAMERYERAKARIEKEKKGKK